MKFEGEGQVFISQVIYSPVQSSLAWNMLHNQSSSIIQTKQLQKYTKDKQIELKAASKEDPDKPFNFDYHFEKAQIKEWAHFPRCFFSQFQAFSFNL